MRAGSINNRNSQLTWQKYFAHSQNERNRIQKKNRSAQVILDAENKKMKF